MTGVLIFLGVLGFAALMTWWEISDVEAIAKDRLENVSKIEESK